MARTRRGSRLLQEVDGFFSIGRKLGQCPQVKDTSRIGPNDPPVSQPITLNEIPLVSAHRRFFLLVYGASPYFSFWRFTAALRSGDSVALSSRIDFPAIRASLKKQLVARFAQGTATHKWWNNLGPTLIDTIIDAYVTPEGIAALISNPEVLKNLRHPQEFRFPTGRTEDWSKVKHAFFTGPRTFVVDREGIKLRFRFTGLGWKLYDLDLSLDEAKQ